MTRDAPRVSGETIKELASLHAEGVLCAGDICKVRRADCCTCTATAEALTAALSAMPAQVPEGWKLVPVEPTVAMWAAGKQAVEVSGANWQGSYRAMLAASPTPPTTAQE